MSDLALYEESADLYSVGGAGGAPWRDRTSADQAAATPEIMPACPACESGDCLAHANKGLGKYVNQAAPMDETKDPRSPAWDGRYRGPADAIAADAPSTALVKKEVIPVSDDTDALTAATVKKMCEYIAQGMRDPTVQQWAAQALTHWARGMRDVGPCSWGVWWMVKHCVKFSRDEPRLFRVGEGDALDMLIAPALLVKMARPKEDCDGFTMLICSMLLALGHAPIIITVAADASTPDRWSHVFPAILFPDGGVRALDASHGQHPGWCVPQTHIFRLQAWDMGGNKIPLPGPIDHAELRRRMHGYVRAGSGMRARNRGMGQCYDELGDPIDCSTITSTDTGADLSSLPVTLPGSSGGTIGSTGIPILGNVSAGGVDVTASGAPGVVGGSSSSSSWASIFNNLISSATTLTKEALLPAGATLTSSGAVVQSPTASQISADMGAWMPIILIVGVILLVMGAEEHKGR